MIQKWLHDRNIQTSANLHDANGIATYEEYYNDACTKLGPSLCTPGHDILFNVTDQNYMETLGDIVMYPQFQDTAKNQNGFDFWWIDWYFDSLSNNP